MVLVIQTFLTRRMPGLPSDSGRFRTIARHAAAGFQNYDAGLCVQPGQSHTPRVSKTRHNHSYYCHSRYFQGEFHKGIMETWAAVLPVVEAAAAAAADNGAECSA